MVSTITALDRDLGPAARYPLGSCLPEPNSSRGPIALRYESCSVSRSIGALGFEPVSPDITRLFRSDGLVRRTSIL